MKIKLHTALIILASCGGRAPEWDAPIDPALDAHGLKGVVAIVDRPTSRLVTLAGREDEQLDVGWHAVGHHVLNVTPAPDASRLFVLAAGDVPRRTERDELPSLTVLDGQAARPRSTRYDMATPASKLAIDAEGRYVAAFAGGDAAFVENPNAIVLFDLAAPPGARNPVTHTFRSYGGTPQRLTFTRTLGLPGGPRRLLLVETDQDVHLLDLDHAFDATPRPEITVPLSAGTGKRLSPAQLVVDDGDPARSDDARVGIRVGNDTGVITLQLTPPESDAGPDKNDFTVRVNMTDVGGVPSDIAFVRTDGGLRLSALVPAITSAVLVEPDTSVTTQVKLPLAYGRLALVTDVVGEPSSRADVALLWAGGSGASGGVAFWTLGKTSGQPYRSVDVLAMNEAVGNVLDVPAPNRELKVLEAADRTGLFVLNLRTRTASPLLTRAQATLSLSPDGARLWAFQKGGSQLSAIGLPALSTVPLVTDHPITGVFDIAREGGGHSLVALHGAGGVSATVFDALAPDTARARTHSSILLRGL